MPNLEDIKDLRNAMNMALALMAKIAQPGMNMDQDRQMQMVGGNDENQFRQYAGQNIGNPNGYNDVQNVRNQHVLRVMQLGIMTQLLLAQKEEAGIQLQAEEFDLMAAVADLDEIEEVNANCILMANCSKHRHRYTKLLEPILEPHQVLQNDNNVISEVTSVEKSGKTVEQHLANVEETPALYDSLYLILAIVVEKVNTVNRKLKETNADLTNELARFKNQEKCFEISQEKYDKLEICYQQSVYQEKYICKR
nr:hypothetical protein [Tanacetum cinerariifolium]